MFNFTIVVFDGTSPTFYFTNTSGWNTSSSPRNVLYSSLQTHVETWWWPSKKAETCYLSNKYSFHHLTSCVLTPLPAPSYSVTLLILSKLNRILFSSGYIKADNATQSTFHEARRIFVEYTSSILPTGVSNSTTTQKLSPQIIFYLRLK